MIELKTSGSALANVFQQLSSALDIDSTLGDLDGLIFGKTLKQTVLVTDDSVAETEKTKLLIGIHSFRILEKSNLYDSVGNLLPTTPNYLKSILETEYGNSGQEIIGWFRFRRNTPLRPSIRELRVHSNLSSLIHSLNSKITSSSSSSSSSSLLFGLFTINSSKNKATHSFDYRFMFIESLKSKPSVYAKNGIEGIELKIANLMHSSEVEYSQISPVILSTPSTNGSLSSELLKIANSTPTYITDLERVFSSALRDLKNLSETINNENMEIEALQDEIRKLSS